MSTFEPRFTITNAVTAGLTTIECARDIGAQQWT